MKRPTWKQVDRLAVASFDGYADFGDRVFDLWHEVAAARVLDAYSTEELRGALFGAARSWRHRRLAADLEVPTMAASPPGYSMSTTAEWARRGGRRGSTRRGRTRRRRRAREARPARGAEARGSLSLREAGDRIGVLLGGRRVARVSSRDAAAGSEDRHQQPGLLRARAR